MTSWRTASILLLAAFIAIMIAQPVACGARQEVNASSVDFLPGGDAVIEEVSIPASYAMLPQGQNALTIDFSYLSEDLDVSNPCAMAIVTLFEKNNETESLVSEGRTDASGRVIFQGLANGTYRSEITVWDDRTVRVYEPVSMVKYHWSTPLIDVQGNTSFSMEISDQERGAWSAYSAILKGADWLEDLTGWRRGMVMVLWPSEDWPHCHGDSIDIPLTTGQGSPVWDEKIVLHEYGHAVHYSARGNNFPTFEGPDTHYIDSETNPKFAFVEGWAEFFAAAAMDTPFRGDGTDLESTVYANGPLGNGDYGDWDGNTVEGAVANVLWDIYDGTSDLDGTIVYQNLRGDQVDREFGKLWSMFLHGDPEEMMDIWRSWENRTGPLMLVFNNARFGVDLTPPSNPDDFSSSHGTDSLSDDSTVDVSLIGAHDDGDEALGYSILWTRDQYSIPDGTIDTSSNQLTSPPLTAGTWYLHVRAVDGSGNVADGTYHIGPFIISVDATDVPPEEEVQPFITTWEITALVVIIGFASLLIFAVSRIVRRPIEDDVGPTEREKFQRSLYQKWGLAQYPDGTVQPVPRSDQRQGENFCPHCGKQDLHGSYCAYCGKKLR